VKIAYADPPYIGQAKRHYNREEVDHRELLARLCCEFPDGWALSLSSPSLPILAPMAKEFAADVRFAAWVKPFAVFKPGVNPAYAWEPVIFRGGRKRSRTEPTVRDWVTANITLKRGLSGAKPDAFSTWLFELMGMQYGDELVDIFPGTYAVTKAWEKWKLSKQEILL
jgi:hypothetical protein